MIRFLPHIAALLLLTSGAWAAADYEAYVSTADNGADTFIAKKNDDGAGEAIDLRIRQNAHAAHWAKVYLRFDLNQFRAAEGKDGTGRTTRAALEVHAGHLHNIGFNKPGSYNVFLLLPDDDYGEGRLGQDWDENALTWDNAPGHNPQYGGGEFIADSQRGHEQGGVDPDRVLWVGRFHSRERAAGLLRTEPSAEFHQTIAEMQETGHATLIITRVNSIDVPFHITSKENDRGEAPKIILLP